MSAATPVEEPEVETFTPDEPKIAVDPMMAEPGPSKGASVSFSELTELPPLKEVYVEPPPPPPVFQPAPAAQKKNTVTTYDGTAAVPGKEEKPKVQPREVAEKAIKEIKGVPPKLMMYSIVGAIVLILAAGLAWFGARLRRLARRHPDSAPALEELAAALLTWPAPADQAPEPPRDAG